MQQCIFTNCASSVSFWYYNGGGAVCSISGTLSISFCTFLSCNANSMGGAVLAASSCTSVVLSYCSFICCTAMYGGGASTHYGSAGEYLSSQFLFCESSERGGGFYHNDLGAASVKVSDSLFVQNCAFHRGSFGGGGFEDFREGPYASHYSFLFFSHNTATFGYGFDISVQNRQLPDSDIIHCFTVTPEKAFWNCASYATLERHDWLPSGTHLSLWFPQQYFW